MFCSNCGKQLPDNAKFCDHCGTKQGQATPAPCSQAVPQEQKTAKTSKKKVAGIVLLCLQAASLLGLMSKDDFSDLPTYFGGGIGGFFEMIGFLLPAIVGTILLVVGSSKKNK